MAGTENNNQALRIYTPQYKTLLEAVVDVKSAFDDAFANVQTLDGITHNALAFTVKANATPVVIGTYNADANVGFGTGTGNSSRFGNRTEVIYDDIDVPYTYDMAMHEGIDNNTINMDFNQAVADRLDLQVQAQTRYMNVKRGKFISDNAGKAVTLADLSQDTITKLFGDMSAYFTNAEVDADLSAFVTPDVFNAVVDMITFKALTGATVDPNNNSIIKWKGFKIVETPAKYFADGDQAYFMANQTVVPFVGIEVTRTIQSEDFNGVALQGYSKGGFFVSDDNKVAIAKVTLTTTETVQA